MKPRLQSWHMVLIPLGGNRHAADRQLSDMFAFAPSVEATLYQLAAVGESLHEADGSVASVNVRR